MKLLEVDKRVTSLANKLVNILDQNGVPLIYSVLKRAWLDDTSGLNDYEVREGVSEALVYFYETEEKFGKITLEHTGTRELSYPEFENFIQKEDIPVLDTFMSRVYSQVTSIRNRVLKQQQNTVALDDITELTTKGKVTKDMFTEMEELILKKHIANRKEIEEGYVRYAKRILSNGDMKARMDLLLQLENYIALYVPQHREFIKYYEKVIVEGKPKIKLKDGLTEEERKRAKKVKSSFKSIKDYMHNVFNTKEEQRAIGMLITAIQSKELTIEQYQDIVLEAQTQVELERQLN